MKLKYYLRGLGIGVLVTAIILHFILPSKESLTDEQIKIRAKELGMTENLTLSDNMKHNNEDNVSSNSISQNENNISDASPDVTISENTVSTKDPDIDVKPTKEPDSTVEPSPNVAASPTHAKTPDDKQKPDATPDKEPSASPSENDKVRMISITVSGGDSSYSVAKKVQSAGLVESAAEFDEFLCNNGYDKVLATGTHKIPENSNFEQIAKLLSGR